MLLSCDHKCLGIFYCSASLVFSVVGVVMSVLLRTELLSSGFRVCFGLSQVVLLSSTTLHGLIMIFYMVMPFLFAGVGNVILGLYIGAADLCCPRLNCFSFNVFVFS